MFDVFAGGAAASLAGGMLPGMRAGEKKKAGLRDAVKKRDWENFFAFVVGKTLPLIWIPAHTVTFLLPAEYRVLMDALLSMLLGALLAIRLVQELLVLQCQQVKKKMCAFLALPRQKPWLHGRAWASPWRPTG
jgi:hypothetical protein